MYIFCIESVKIFMGNSLVWHKVPIEISKSLNCIYLFIYCHLYSAFSIVQSSNALYRLYDRSMTHFQLYHY